MLNIQPAPCALCRLCEEPGSRLRCGAGDACSCRTASLLPEASFPDIISFKKDFSSGYWLSFLLRALGAGCVVVFSKKLLFARNNHAENQQDFGFVFIFFMLL